MIQTTDKLLGEFLSEKGILNQETLTNDQRNSKILKISDKIVKYNHSNTNKHYIVIETQLSPLGNIYYVEIER